VRRGGKVVQETVAQQGELDAEGRAKARSLARQITGRGEQHELFDLSYDLLLYDVTSTYFEGLAAAARGHSRDHRPDCKQVCIAHPPPRTFWTNVPPPRPTRRLQTVRLASPRLRASRISSPRNT
jgi:hypothetical protein